MTHSITTCRAARISAIIIAVVAATGLPSRAAPANPGDRDPLATKQQLVRDRMTQLEDRMFRLIDQLAKTEPEQAERLEAALRRARELLIQHNMDETIELLDERALANAADRQLLIIRDLERVLELMLAEPDRTKERKKEIERLKAFSQQVRKLLDAQRALKDRSAPAATQPASSSQAATEQRELGKQAGELSSDMAGKENGESKDGKNPSEQDDDVQAPIAPGTEHVEQSGQHMDKAAGQLDQRDTSGASGEQQEAVNELEQALEALQQALDQLRREQQEEILPRLEARFRAMLTGQIAVKDGTEQLDAKGRAAWDHSDELMLAGLTGDQRGLADQAGQALHILEEDGTTIVFPRVVRQMREDMQHVAQRLQARETGGRTAQLQGLIVETLEQLIAAMKQLQAELQSGEGGQSGDPGEQDEPPLLPNSAELKMLRSCQQRVNQATATLDDEDADSEAAETRRLSDRQAELAELARRMHERVSGE